MGNWRDEFATPAEKVASLRGKSTLADMVFIVGSDQVRIPGHRFVLSLVSESFESCDSEIHIADFEADVFMEFLGFIYTGEVTLGDDTALEILKLAHRYKIDLLVRDCMDFLRRNISVANVLQCLNLGINLGMTDLKAQCLDVISDFTLAVVQQEAFLEISRETLSHILELEIIICTEHELFQAVMRWADAECQRQEIEGNCENCSQVLGDVAELIRYAAMEPEFTEEFRSLAKKPAKSRSLSSALPTFFDYGHAKLTILSPLDRIHLSPDAVRECALEFSCNQLVSVFGFGVIVEMGAELEGWAEMCYKYDGAWVELKKNVTVSVGCRWKFGAKHEIVFLLLKEKLTLALSNYIYRIVLHNQAATLTHVFGDVFNETAKIPASDDGEATTVSFSRQEDNYIPMILVQSEKFA